MRCIIEENKLIFPEGFRLPKKEMVLVPSSENCVKIYTQKKFEDLLATLHSTADEYEKIMIARFLCGHAQIINSRQRKIKLTEKVSEILKEGEAELTVEDDVVIIKALSCDE